MDMPWSSTQQPVVPSQESTGRNSSEDEPIVVDVPNQHEINDVARLLKHEHRRVSLSQAASQRRDTLIRRLEALHDDPTNEKAILFNKLHEPLQDFLQLTHVKQDQLSSNLQSRGETLLLLWGASLNRRRTAYTTPASQKYASPALTPAGTLWLPRDVSDSPEPDAADNTSMDLDMDQRLTPDRRSFTEISRQLFSTRHYARRISPPENTPGRPAIKDEKAIICGLCSVEVLPNPLSIRQHIRSIHNDIMGMQWEIPKNLMEYCDEHDLWFVHKNRERHYNGYSYQHTKSMLPSKISVFDPSTLSRSSRRRPISNIPNFNGKSLDMARRSPSEDENLGDRSEEAEDSTDEDGIDRPLSQSTSPTTSSDVDQTSLTTSEENDNILPVGPYNLRTKQNRKASANPTEQMAELTTVSRKPSKRSQERNVSSSTIMVRSSKELQPDLGSPKRTWLQANTRRFKTALKKCETSGDVQRLVAERVASPADDTEIFDAQSRSSISVRESMVESMVRERANDDDFVADVCDIPDHHERILYLEAQVELLTRRNVALEGARAQFNALAQRAMYGESKGTWNDRQQALDQLVREHLDWRVVQSEDS